MTVQARVVVEGRIVEADPTEFRTLRQGGPGSGRKPEGGKFAPEKPQSDDERMTDKFAKSEKPAQRAARIKGMKVDPERQGVIKKALGSARARFTAQARTVDNNPQASAHFGAPDGSGSVAHVTAEGGPGSGRRPGGGRSGITKPYQRPPSSGQPSGTAVQIKRDQMKRTFQGDEAMAVSAGAPLLRSQAKLTLSSEHDEDVPAAAFRSDLKRKLSLRQVMGKPDDQEGERDGAEDTVYSGALPKTPHSAAEDEGLWDEIFGDGSDGDGERQCHDQDGFPVDCDSPDAVDASENDDKDPRRPIKPYGMAGLEDEAGSKQVDKESVNYRYAQNPDQSCGKCRFFQAPSGCAKVSGLIRKIDVCDLFQARGNGAAGPVQARVSEAIRCTARLSDSTLRTMWLSEQEKMRIAGYVCSEGEVAPPGWEGTVKAMKKHPEIDNPWALSWYMDNQGYTPHR